MSSREKPFDAQRQQRHAKVAGLSSRSCRDLTNATCRFDRAELHAARCHLSNSLRVKKVGRMQKSCAYAPLRIVYLSTPNIGAASSLRSLLDTVRQLFDSHEGRWQSCAAFLTPIHVRSEIDSQRNKEKSPEAREGLSLKPRRCFINTLNYLEFLENSADERHCSLSGGNQSYQVDEGRFVDTS